MKLVSIVFLIFTSLLYSQTRSITGSISNNKSGKPIVFVNIGVQGTYFGTSSNEFGKFKLMLKNGKHNLIFSCVGYKTEIVSVTIPNSNDLSISLKPISIVLPEVVVNSENPAYAIIRKAIANKEKNKEGLQNYHYNFYSKIFSNQAKKLFLLRKILAKDLQI